MKASIGLLGLLAVSGPAWGDMAPPNSVLRRFTEADCVVVGRVSEIEAKTVKLIPPWGGTAPSEFQVGVVKVGEAFKGAKGLTHVKVAFRPPSGGREGRPPTHLKAGQEGVFFLTKHAEEPYYFAPGYFSVVDKVHDDYKQRVGEVKHCAGLAADPDKGLASKDAKDRATTAMMLLLEYRKPVRGQKQPKTEPVAAERSKLVLEVLAELDWAKAPAELGWDLHPKSLFLSLGLTKDDGWQQPREGKDFEAAAKKWLTKNAGRHRLHRVIR